MQQKDITPYVRLKHKPNNFFMRRIWNFETIRQRKRQSNLKGIKCLEEEKDYQVIIKALEQKVKPSNEELSASSKYFYLRQGNATLVDFFKQATEIVEAMNIDEDPKDKTLRNLLMNGLTSREIYSKRVMEIASNIEARNLMDEDLSDMANQLLPSNALSRGSPSTNSCVNNYLNLYHVAGVVEESDVDDKNAQPGTPNATSVERWDIGASDPQKSDIHLIEAEVDFRGRMLHISTLRVQENIWCCTRGSSICDHKSLWRPTDMQKRWMSCKSCREPGSRRSLPPTGNQQQLSRDLQTFQEHTSFKMMQALVFNEQCYPPFTLHNHRDTGRSTQVWETRKQDLAILLSHLRDRFRPFTGPQTISSDLTDLQYVGKKFDDAF
ncbi:hypothetical protein CAPTEDRAFT_215243 [Capitella teleta]|uniref:Uncharacterized protein n=1 Tax=Capitella teleta TaxID=283909 RepID=R7VFW6_CAPTE|nr:hypothetical protein CAPTEDRAFT_215243 [Capitella teleta]|eukprot:ELU17467.1 hypothetical protein CAPTEDRAFT_215243 [Capitella teleta]